MKAPPSLRIILDVNVIVSALISRSGFPGQILANILEEDSKVKLVMSREILDELEAVLSYPSVKKYVRMSDSEIDGLLLDFELISEIYDTEGHTSDIRSRDPDDDKYIILAEAAKPEFLVTGDDDLLVLKNVQQTEIVKPAGFVCFL